MLVMREDAYDYGPSLDPCIANQDPYTPTGHDHGEDAMSRDDWFRQYERLIDNGAPHSTETAERARDAQRGLGSDLDRADEAKKRERGE
jgi:hypothetical protein